MTRQGGADAPAFSVAFSLMVSCPDQSEVDRLWDALSEGGAQMQCGWVTDRFGVTWQTIPTRLGDLLQDPDPERAGRVMQAMLGMQRIDIAALEAAAG